MRTTNLDGNSIFLLKSDLYVTAITKEDYDAMTLDEHRARIVLEWADVNGSTAEYEPETVSGSQGRNQSTRSVSRAA